MIYFLWISFGLIFAYVLIVILIYRFQHRLIFRPISLPQKFCFEFPIPYQELWLGNRKNLNSILFLAPNPKGVVLYHHGNSRNNQYWGQFASDFVSRGYHILFYDYRTFGKSTGKLTETSLYRDARIANNYLKGRFPELTIFQFGRSLGSALATHLARVEGSPFLVLETPYLSMKKMAQKSFPFLPINFILKYNLRQDFEIQEIKCPILILSGTDDELTPHSHSHQLASMNPNTELVVLNFGAHNGLNQYHEYQLALDRYYGPKLF